MPHKPEDKDEAESLKQTLGAQIRALRQGFGWSQDELAESIGVGTEMLRRYERGSKFPSHLTLIRLSKTLNTSIDVLLGIDRPAEPTWLARGEDLARLLKKLTAHQRQVLAILVREMVNGGRGAKR
jgi:transcriptional regulator with XRE-family HTH domain